MKPIKNRLTNAPPPSGFHGLLATAVAAGLLLITLVGSPTAAAQTTPQQAGQQQQDFEATLSADAARWDPTPEELEEALEKWVNEYVIYLITDEERRIFERLPRSEQRLAFTERFWDIRDPTPGTPLNEYRRDHFQRWATANRRFSAGKAGWRKRLLTAANLKKLRAIATLARRKNRGMSQIALGWILRRPELTSCIIGASRPEQIEENVKASRVSFSAAELEKLDAILQ